MAITDHIKSWGAELATDSVRKATGKLFDYLSHYITLTDNEEFNAVLKNPQTQALIKKIVTDEVIKAFSQGAPTDEEGRYLHKTEAERVAASLVSIGKEMWTRGTDLDQLTDDIAFFDRNVESLRNEIATHVEGVAYDYQKKIQKANHMIDKAASWFR